MRIRLHELDNQLKRAIAPIYLLSGDEPLQMGEAADTVRKRSREQGYSEREILDVDGRFDWGRLTAEASNLSLFAERRIIDLRVTGGKPGVEGGKALIAYAQRPPEDTLLLITLPKLERSQLNTKWFKGIEKAGVVIQIWPVEGERLIPWIEKRMRTAGLTPAPGVVSMLAEHVEGNLLAAVQEIDKLVLLHETGVVTPEQLAASATDSARFGVFELVDSALSGDVSRCVRILSGLEATGIPAPVVLWALTREIRTLCSLSREIDKGRSPAQAIATRRDIWAKRKPLVNKGLSRSSTDHWRRLLASCGDADRGIKGFSGDDPWLLLQDITLGVAGKTAIRNSRPSK
ncbi:MAG: DNA polymerase III subunit delta [Gammaproteobacteria bacterium]|nr:DNA polymerase III subunit delta [Gammaproteobacteria bacterium]